MGWSVVKTARLFFAPPVLFFRLRLCAVSIRYSNDLRFCISERFLVDCPVFEVIYINAHSPLLCRSNPKVYISPIRNGGWRIMSFGG